MVARVEVWRAANVLIREHGDAAVGLAEEMADELRSQGDLEGRRLLRAIVEAIVELQRVSPNEGERIN